MTKHPFLYLILWLIIGVTLSSQNPSYFYSPLNKYLGDLNYSTIFQSFSQRKQLFGILFTNKHCQYCYQDEAELIEIINEVYNKEKIVIYRTQLSQNEEMQSEFHIKRFPMLHFVLPKKIQRNNPQIQEKWDPFQNIHPQIYLSWDIVTLKTTLNTITKLKFYLNQSTDISPQLDQIIVRSLYFSEDDLEMSIRFGILNFLHQSLPLVVFKDETQFNQLLLQDDLSSSYIKTCDYYYPLMKKCFEIQKNDFTPSFELNQIEYLHVAEFNEYTYEQRKYNFQYIFVAVLDSIFERKQSQEYLKILEKLLNKIELRDTTIFWMESQINRDKLKHLGFNENDRPPLFALFDLNDPKKKTFGNKKGEQFQQISLLKFINNIRKVRGAHLQLQQKKYLNEELLKDSLKRLGLDKKIKYIEQNQVTQFLKNSKKNQFLLWLPYANLKSLDNHQLWYEHLFSFYYFVKRILRFSNKQPIEMYVLFGKDRIEIIDQRSRIQVSSQSLLKIQKIQSQIMLNLQKKYNLPEYFWVNENRYLQYIEGKPLKPSFDQTFIQI